MATKGVNQVTLLGRIGNDIELNKTKGGKSVASFSVATTETWRDQQGAKQEHTDWHNVVVWGARADVAAGYAVKGDQIYLQGKNRSRQYKDKNGVEHWITEVIVDQDGDLQLIGNKPVQP